MTLAARALRERRERRRHLRGGETTSEARRPPGRSRALSAAGGAMRRWDNGVNAYGSMHGGCACRGAELRIWVMDCARRAEGDFNRRRLCPRGREGMVGGYFRRCTRSRRTERNEKWLRVFAFQRVGPLHCQRAARPGLIPKQETESATAAVAVLVCSKRLMLGARCSLQR